MRLTINSRAMLNFDKNTEKRYRYIQKYIPNIT